MDLLWAPWRAEYINSKKSRECILCIKPNEKRDKENLILYRSKFSYVIMNLYPYNNGHLMITPYKHCNSLEALKDASMLDIMKTTNCCVKVLRKAFKPEGFNIGINMGKVAGAGIDDHVHIHVLPRWNGDTNFMPVLGETKVMSEHIEATYLKLSPFFRELKGA